ncbi:MAG: Ig-like domain-containing protein [Dokdonella sp.]|uniref:Ig-like domain-containing protein n=1 Tax=Dokdonella sp. TaxID=2291710 RepID=UPI0032668A80
MERRTLLAAAIGLALSATSVAQTASPPGTPPTADAMVPVTYVGSNARVSLGVNEHGDVLGEVLGILGKTDEHAWLGQLWLGQGGSGGAQVDYHWLRGGADAAIEHPDDASVMKVFGAFDQNAWKDRKVSLGVGWEKNDFSVDGYLTHATSGSRLASTTLTSDVTQIGGSDGNGDYTQTQTIDTLTQAFEHPYDNGIGARFGKYFDEPLLRVRGGVDYERGKYSSDQFTLSLGLDKYFANSGFSLSLLGEALRKSGDFETDKNDTRGWLLLRYDIGQNYRARDPYRMVQVERAAPAVAPPPAAPQVLRNEVKLDGDAFFNFDHAELRPDAIAALDTLIAKLQSASRVSRVSVVGHTDSVGPAAYNQKLSERRAASAQRYLVAHGIEADQIDASGAGELDPAYPNDTPANRQKNRRVDVEFLSIEETTTAPPTPERVTPGVEWVKEPVKAPPAWIERALRNPAEHKRTVDVYRFEKTTSTTTLGPKEYTNHPPVAQDDTAAVDENSTDNPIAVLANDSDPDGDALTVTAVSPPAHGSAAATATGVSYTPAANYLGTDAFTYTISDGKGGTATATVHVTVSTPNHPPVAGPLSVRVLKGESITIPVLQAASDPDGDVLTVVSIDHTGPIPTNLVTLNGDGTVTYQSIHGWFGQDFFEYTVSDGHGGTATGTINVYVFELPPFG